MTWLYFDLVYWKKAPAKWFVGNTEVIGWTDHLQWCVDCDLKPCYTVLCLLWLQTGKRLWSCRMTSTAPTSATSALRLVSLSITTTSSHDCLLHYSNDESINISNGWDYELLHLVQVAHWNMAEKNQQVFFIVLLQIFCSPTHFSVIKLIYSCTPMSPFVSAGLYFWKDLLFEAHKFVVPCNSLSCVKGAECSEIKWRKPYTRL